MLPAIPIFNLPTIPIAITCDHYITRYSILPKVINFIIITSNPLGDKPQLPPRGLRLFHTFCVVTRTVRWMRRGEGGEGGVLHSKFLGVVYTDKLCRVLCILKQGKQEKTFNRIG